MANMLGNVSEMCLDPLTILIVLGDYLEYAKKKKETSWPARLRKKNIKGNKRGRESRWECCGVLWDDISGHRIKNGWELSEEREI